MDISPIKGFSNLFEDSSEKFKGTNPLVLILITVILIFYYTIFNSFSKATVNAAQNISSPSLNYIEMFLWGLFIFLLLINGLQYFFSLDITTTIKNVFSGKPKFDIKVSDGKVNLRPTYSEEVFHVVENDYNYDDAKAVCKAYNSRLATYNEIEKAYQKGAEWCSYGWSENQLALFPTQKSTYKKLSKIKGHKHDCGRPGINGGFVNNKNAKFGANCYGYKPKMKPIDQYNIMNNVKIPMTKEEKLFNDKVKTFKSEKNEIAINSFNNAKWNQI
tara:strand:- start:145 stop:966 length:822 start_codon:yes stop_codon:yes gene_type:complete